MRLGFTNLWAISGPFQTLPFRLPVYQRGTHAISIRNRTDSGDSQGWLIGQGRFLKKEPGQGLGLLTKTLGVKPLVVVL